MSAYHRTGREDGLSLVEMMVGLLIVGLVLAALASSLVTALRAVRGQESTTQATAAINDILEETQRVDYDQAVLCESTATTTFGGTTFEGEDLVLSPAACGTSDEIKPEWTPPPRDGRSYDVTTAITWADDDYDGVGVGDSDSPQDIKRIIVDVSWTEDGQTRNARNVAFRAPQYREQLVTAEVVADDGSEFIMIGDDPTNSDPDLRAGKNNEALTLRAFAREKLTSVEVSWVDRNGNAETGTMGAVGSDGLVWEYPLHANFGPFANGGTLFEFDALAASGEREQVAARGLFLYDPMTVLDGGVVAPSSKIQVDEVDGLACPGQSFWIEAKGAIRSDVARAKWTRGTTETSTNTTTQTMANVDALTEDVALSGARFELDLGGVPGFATLNTTTGTYVGPSGNAVKVTLWVERIVDSGTAEFVISSFPVEMVSSC